MGDESNYVILCISFLRHCIFFCSGTPGEIDAGGLQLTLPRVIIYRAICERLEAIGHVTDAIDCFHEMISELGGDVYMSRPMTEWVSGEFMFHLFVCHTFNVSGQISPTDVSPFPEATVRRQRRPLHHF